MHTSLTKTVAALSLSAALAAPLAMPNAAHADSTTVELKCVNSVCGTVKYYGGRVRILLSSTLTRTTHFNVKTNPGIPIQVGSGYAFDRQPGQSGTYSVQACQRGFRGRSTCAQWATFDWNSGAQ